MVKVSVLVAVYNAEKYLRKCLDSLMGQTLKEIQVICVDDASTDGSWGILKEYASKDDRFEIVRLDTNSGQAHARNVGLARVRGEYVCFLDSDDWFDADSLALIAEKFESNSRIDCVLFKCMYVDEEKGVWEYDMERFGVMTGKEAFVKSINWDIHGVYAVKARLHRSYPYDDSSLAYSDDNTTRIHYIMSDLVADSDAKYFYLQHRSSVTHQVSLRRFDYLAANRSMKEQLLSLNVEDVYISEYENIRWINVVALFLFAQKNRRVLSPHDYQMAMGELRKAWQNIEPSRLKMRNRIKIGYVPFRNSWIPYRLGWKLFCWEENVYYLLRKCLRRLPS